MAGFTSIALALALGIQNINVLAIPIADVQYGRLIYEVRSVNDARGIGGSPPYCAAATEDLVMILYTVRNENDFQVSAQAIPRLVMLDPQGNVLQPDQARTEAMTSKLSPYLRVRNGVMPAHSIVLLADIFVTPKQAVRVSPWRFRAAPVVTRPVKLPIAKRAEPAEC